MTENPNSLSKKEGKQGWVSEKDLSSNPDSPARQLHWVPVRALDS